MEITIGLMKNMTIYDVLDKIICFKIVISLTKMFSYKIQNNIYKLLEVKTNYVNFKYI